MMTSGKVITRCGDCVHYNFKKHKCNVVYSAEIDPKEKFYADCTTFENVEEMRERLITGLLMIVSKNLKSEETQDT